MLKHPTLDLLHQLGLTGMAEAFTRFTDNEESAGLSHTEWLALLLDQEASWRNDKRLALRLRNAKLPHPAVPEDIIRRAPREYDRRVLDLLLTDGWIRKHENCAIVGPTGIGKSWLACAFGAQGLPRQSFGPLCSNADIASEPGAGSRNREPRFAPEKSRQRRASHP